MRAIRRVLRLIPVLLGLLLVLGILLAALGRIDRTVGANGVVRIERYQVVRPQVAGLVTRVQVEPGDTVRPGQVLAEMRDYDLQRELLSVERQLLQERSAQNEARRRLGVLTGSIQPAESGQERAELQRLEVEVERRAARVRELRVELAAEQSRLRRSEELGKAGLISVDELEEARNRTLQSEWRLKQGELEEQEGRAELRARREGGRLLGGQQEGNRLELEARIREQDLLIGRLEEQLRQMREMSDLHTLRASVGGVVVGPSPEELMGRRPQAGEDLFQIIDVQSILFVAQVPEEQIVKVRPEQRAYVEVRGLPKRRFDVFLGRVRKVGQQPKLEEAGGRIFYDVEIALDSPWVDVERGRFYLRNGMSGEAEIVYLAEVTVLEALWDLLVGEG